MGQLVTAYTEELIDRNIKRATDAKQADFMELSYEAYGHGGVGIVMVGGEQPLNPIHLTHSLKAPGFINLWNLVEM
jgi:hypothetical protein